MTHKKNIISIYNYPEHLNPFREGADDSDDRLNTTVRRRSSFRVNTWNVFSPKKGKSKAFDDDNSVDSKETSRFMTWTPKLFRKASFLRSSPGRSTVGPREIQTSSVSRLSSQSNATERTLPPSSSRSSLPPSSSRSSLPPSSSRSASHSNGSRSTLPPNDSLYTLSFSKPTSPPGRPALPNVRTSLSPGTPPPPGPITLAVTASTENATSKVNTGSRQTTPVPTFRKVLFPSSPSDNTVNEQPSKDETSYTKQGAKPKKKRKAPVPPVSPPGKSTSDIQQYNSNEADASVTSSVPESSSEDPKTQEELATATSNLQIITQEPQSDTRNRELHDPWIRKSEQQDEKQSLNSENGTLKLHFEIEEKHSEQSNSTGKHTQELDGTRLNGHSESGDEVDKIHITSNGDPITVEKVPEKQVEHGELPGSRSADGCLEQQSAPENELQENLNQVEDGNLNCQQDRDTQSTECRSHLGDNVRDNRTETTKNTYTSHNGKNLSSGKLGLQNGEELTSGKKSTNLKKPKPKTRTALQSI